MKISIGIPLRIELERFQRAEKVVMQVANEIFTPLGVSDQEFVEQNRLNDEVAITRWEKFITKTAKSQREARALQLVDFFIDKQDTPS